MQRTHDGPERVTSHQAIVRLLLKMDRTKQFYVELRKIGRITRTDLEWTIALW